MEISLPEPGVRPSRARAARDLLLRALVRARSWAWALGDVLLALRGPDAGIRVLAHCHPSRRPALLRRLGARVGEGVTIQSPFWVQNAKADLSHLEIGDDVFIGPAVLVDLTAPVSIGARVAISAYSALVTHIDVGPGQLAAAIPPRRGPLEVGADAYLGTRATLLHGVRIGEAAVIGAGAVVRASVPAQQIAVGVPARLAGPTPQPSPHA